MSKLNYLNYLFLVQLSFFCIIHHVIIICRIRGGKLYLVIFYIYKVGVGFTSPSEHMHHSSGNEARHIKL
jgi:hypothetical protein